MAIAHHCMAFSVRIFSWFWRGFVAEPSVFIRPSVACVAAEAHIFEDFGIEDRRADFVGARGPFAEIDLAAAVAAERKVLVAQAHDHSAGGAMEELGGFLL